MSNIEVALYYQVVHTSGITDIISTRFYAAGDVPQSPEFPYATFQKISNVHNHSQGAASTLAQARYQIDCWAEMEKGAFVLSEAFRAAFGQYRGDMGETGNTTPARVMFLQNDQNDFTVPTGGKQRGKHRVTMDFIIAYVEV